jgi:hypothetical protein
MPLWGLIALMLAPAAVFEAVVIIAKAQTSIDTNRGHDR